MPGSLPEIGVQAVVGGLPQFQRSLDSLNKAVDQSRRSIEQRAAASTAMGESDTTATAASGALSIAQYALVASVAAVAAVVGTGVAAMEEMTRAIAGVSARTGDSVENLRHFRTVIEDVAKSGLSDNFDDIAKTAEHAKYQIDDLLDNDDGLEIFTRRAIAMGQAWETSATDITDSVDALIDKFPAMDQHMQVAGMGMITLYGHTITGAEGLDLLTAAAQRSHLPLGKIDQIVQQYGSTFSAMGLSANEFFGLIVKGGDKGVDNFRFMQTALDNFHKGIVQPPKGFNAALQKLGLSKTAYELKNNTISMSQALDRVFTVMGDKSIPAATRMDAAMALFGKNIDKIGGPEALAKLAGFSDAMDNAEGSAEKVAATMEDDGTLGTAIRKFGANLKVNLEQGAQWVYERIKSIDWSKIGEGISALGGILWTNVQAAINELAANIRKNWNLIGDAFQTIWNFVSSNVGTLGADLWAKVQTAINDIAANIRGATGTITDAFATIWKGVTQDLPSGLSTLWSQVSGKISEVVTGISTRVSEVTAAAGTIGKAILDAIGAESGRIQARVSEGITTMINFIPGLIGQVTAAAGQIANAVVQPISDKAATIWGIIKGAIDDLNAKVSTLVAGVQTTFEAIAQAIITALAPAISFIQSIVTAIGQLSSSFATAAGIAHGLHIPGFAGGGELGEGWSVVGENGPELLYKQGIVTQVISNRKSGALMGSAQQAMIHQAAMTMNVLPQASPMAVPQGTTNNTTNNNARNMTVNMHGVKNGSDALQRLAMLNATRKM